MFRDWTKGTMFRPGTVPVPPVLVLSLHISNDVGTNCMDVKVARVTDNKTIISYVVFTVTVNFK